MTQDTPQYPIEGSPGLEATSLVALERLDRDVFRTRFSEHHRNDHLFGGQVLAQALAAAGVTVQERTCHSIHAYFLRAGSASQRIIFRVERTRDGGRFSTRRVIAEQNSRPIFHMECSYHNGENGLEHQLVTIPDVPMPEQLPGREAIVASAAACELDGMFEAIRLFPLVDARIVDVERQLDIQPSSRRQIWIRVPSAASSDDPAVHQQLLAYLSDFMFAGVALLPHPVKYRVPQIFLASLDHAMWFHRPHRCEEWLLYDCDSPMAGQGRGMAHGRLLDRAGRLVATVMQEALMRMR